jgi:serine phosphatase RsbU (regulator of sigma subunit)
VATIVRDSAELTADGLADKILEEADSFSGGQHPADDRTLLVLKVR